MGEWLVDMHGPHEHQSLLQPARQLAILDAFASLEALRREWETEWNRRKEIAAERAAMVSNDALHAQQLELLRHQAMEIESARLSPEEEGMLTAEFQRISNAARLMESTRMAQALLSDGEDSIFDRVGELGRLLTEIQRHDPAATHLFDAHVSATEALQELNTLLSRYFDRLDLDPERLQELEERINLIQSLKRKYGTTVADVVTFGETCRVKLAEWDGLEERAEQLAAELAQIDKRLLDLGGQLTRRRQQAIPRLNREVSQHLGELGFRQSRVDVELSTVEDPGSTGFDHCEFQFAPNPGEPARPLRAIASSGELARVMLALKTVLASADEIPVLIFDEVDANVGGETGLAVGQKLRGIADRHQVLCITHLAPVAAQGHSQYLVSKQVTDGRTESRIERLDGPSRVTEIARMLGGQSAAARRHAEELLGQNHGIH
jgi:DNA repair protein RecN (Recombination protein N)